MVTVGDAIDGGKVAAIGESDLRYIKGGKNITLKVPKGQFLIVKLVLLSEAMVSNKSLYAALETSTSSTFCAADISSPSSTAATSLVKRSKAASYNCRSE